jgi:hypothetical protein
MGTIFLFLFFRLSSLLLQNPSLIITQHHSFACLLVCLLILLSINLICPDLVETFTAMFYRGYVLLLTLVTTQIDAFSGLSSLSRQSVALHAAGRGMGTASVASPAKKNGMAKANGMGSSKSKKGGKSKVTSSFDVSSALIRSEKRYDELMLASNKLLARDDEDPRWASEKADEQQDEIITSEYIVAVRAQKTSGCSDWVPVAQMCVARPSQEYHEGTADEAVKAAVSANCRELSFAATLGAPKFSTCARSDLQYSVESRDSFFKFVYETVVEGGAKQAKQHPEQHMSKAQAREALGLESDTNDKSEIKQSYRKLSFQLHPDRFEGTEEESEAAALRFGRVKLAYETMSSGVREEGGSWYQSLGGRARTGFVGPVNLLPLAAATEYVESKKIASAVIGLERDLVQGFVARNLRSV